MRYAIVTVSALAALAAGQPMVDKREMEIVTEVVKVVKTIDVTTTVYVDAATAAPEAYVPPVVNHQAKPSHGHKHAHPNKPKHHSPHKPKYNAPPHKPEDNKPKDNKPKDNKPKDNKPKDNKPKHDKPKHDKPKHDKPKHDKPKHDKPKPKPIEVYTPPPPPPAYTPPPVAPKHTPRPKPDNDKPAPGAPVGDVNVGEMTYYTPGLGSCGVTNSESEPVVALAVDMMNNPANPNLNPKCGQYITIDYQGRRHKAKVMDTCYACATSDIDLSPTLFGAVAPSGDGRVHGVKWWWGS